MGLQQESGEWQGRVEAAVGQPIIEGHANKLRPELDGIACLGKDAERMGGLGETGMARKTRSPS